MCIRDSANSTRARPSLTDARRRAATKERTRRRVHRQTRCESLLLFVVNPEARPRTRFRFLFPVRLSVALASAPGEETRATRRERRRRTLRLRVRSRFCRRRRRRRREPRRRTRRIVHLATSLRRSFGDSPRRGTPGTRARARTTALRSPRTSRTRSSLAFSRATPRRRRSRSCWKMAFWNARDDGDVVRGIAVSER